MKKIIILLSIICSYQFQANAQCSPVANNYEMKLVPNSAAHELRIQMRYHANAVKDANDIMLSKQLQMDGLIFAITYPNTSAVAIEKCTSTLQPFSVAIDKGIGAQNKNMPDNITTFYQNSDVPTAFPTDWTADQWYTIAVVNYSGELAPNDYFSFVTCDYGLAHPNAKYGNSHTDPWFAVMNGIYNYYQFSPKMITELPEANAKVSCDVYPNPTSGNVNIDVEVTSNVDAVVKVLDIKGAVVKIINMQFQKGKNTNSINIEELVNGEYLLQITDGKAFQFAKKITKQ
jgi:Secretion system C-terminal sorting domain